MRELGLGLGLALAAYGLWGCFPLFFYLLAEVPALVVLAQRIVWAFAFTALALLLLGRARAWLAVLFAPAALAWLAVSSIFIGINWLVFIWAVANARVLEASLGYFITPLVSLLLGRWLLQETMNRLQIVAGLVAAVAVLFEVFTLGRLPWVALVLALSFGCYGLVRKRFAVHSLVGLNIESLILGLPALVYLLWQGSTGHAVWGQDARDAMLLAASGAVTAVPLILFAAATRRLDLSVVGFVMYLNPTLQFLSAVFILDEPYPPARLITFAIIWFAMGLFVWGLLRARTIAAK